MNLKLLALLLVFFINTFTVFCQLYSFPWKVKDADLGCFSALTNPDQNPMGILEYLFEFENTYGDTILIKEIRHVGIAKLQFDSIIPPGATGKIHYKRFESFYNNEIHEIVDLLQINTNINPWETVSVRAYIVGNGVKEILPQADGTTIYRQDYRTGLLYNQLHIDAQGKMISFGLISASGNKWNNWKERKDGKIVENNYGFIVDVETKPYSSGTQRLQQEEVVFTGYIGEESYPIELLGVKDYSGLQMMQLKTGTTKIIAQTSVLEGAVIVNPERLVNSMSFKICLAEKHVPFIYMHNMVSYFEDDTTWYGLGLKFNRTDSVKNLAELKEIEKYLSEKGVQEFRYQGFPHLLVFNLNVIPVKKRYDLIDKLKRMNNVEMVGLWYAGCAGVGGAGLFTGDIIVEKKFPEYHNNLNIYNELWKECGVNADYDYSYNYVRLTYLGQINSQFIASVNKIAESGHFYFTAPSTFFPVEISYDK